MNMPSFPAEQPDPEGAGLNATTHPQFNAKRLGAEIARRALEEATEGFPAGAPVGYDPVDVSRATRFNTAVQGRLYGYEDDSWKDPVMLAISKLVQQETANQARARRVEGMLRALLEIEATRG